MNPRTYRHTSSAQQLPEAIQGRVPLSGYPEDIQDLYGAGIAQAVEFATSAYTNAVRMNSAMLDFYRHFFWYPFGLEFWFEGQNQSFAKWMELGTQWLGAFTPQAGSAPVRVVREPRSRQEKAEMEDGMDVAVEAFEDEILA